MHLAVSTHTWLTMTLPHHNYPPLHNISTDCINIIFQYHIFPNSLSQQICRILPASATSTTSTTSGVSSSSMGHQRRNFLNRFGFCWHVSGNGSIREFLISHRPRNVVKSKYALYYLKLTDVDLRKLIENGTVEYMRGIYELDIWDSSCLTREDMDTLFQNIRGVKKLSLRFGNAKITRQHLVNLRGIKELILHNCNFTLVEQSSFANLSGIQKACFVRCCFHSDSLPCRYLRGIKEFSLHECRDHSSDPLPFPCDTLRNFRGIQVLHLRGVYLKGANNALFRNIRGVKDIYLEGLRNISSGILKELRGVESATFRDCDHVRFVPLFLKNLRGIRELKVITSASGDVLGDVGLEHLHGVEKLFFQKELSVMYPRSFRHLSAVKYLCLNGKAKSIKRIALSDVALSHLKNVRHVVFKKMNLEGFESFSSEYLLSLMPKLECLGIIECLLPLDAKIPSAASYNENTDAWSFGFTRINNEMVHIEKAIEEMHPFISNEKKELLRETGTRKG